MTQINPGHVRRMDSAGAGLLKDHEWAALAQSLRLSARELQIVHGVFDDLKDGAIAERLGLSTHTVRTHFERLYRKLAVSSRSGLVVRVFLEFAKQYLDGDPNRPVENGKAVIEVINQPLK